VGELPHAFSSGDVTRVRRSETFPSHLAYWDPRVKADERLFGGAARTSAGKSCRIAKKTVYQFAGFDDYPIANLDMGRAFKTAGGCDHSAAQVSCS